MTEKLNYRKRCYEAYISGHWKFRQGLSKEAYDLFAKVSRIRFKDVLPADKEARIIDVACGPGHFLYFLQSEGYVNAAGIDLGDEQLSVAGEMGIKKVKQADLFEYLPDHPESFDMIIANDIIEHLRKDEVIDFLDAIHHSLKKNGTLLVGTLNAQSLFGAGLVFIDFTHEQGFTAASLAQVLRACNFKEVSVYGEKPVAHDFRSALRVVLWWFITKVATAYVFTERGTGRGLFNPEHLFEPRMFAIGKKL